MKIYFKDEMFDGQLLRVLNNVYYGGADVGEAISTAQRIKDGDTESWYSEWLATAERVHALGEASLAAGHTVSAREAFMRAATYYRIAYLFLFGTSDGRLEAAYDKQRATFQQATALLNPVAEAIEIPYEGTTLSGYFFSASDDGLPRPTVLALGGYDGTAEEVYLFNAVAALRRGYNCLAFDGPGQGYALVKQGLYFRPDYEQVVTPAVDYLLTRSDVDGQRIALIGLSFGGYLAARAASGEHRLAACIVDPGEYDLYQALIARMPHILAAQLPHGNAAALKVLELALDHTAKAPTGGWGLRRGMWTHGVSTPLAYVLATQPYSMAGRAEQIQCPTLVCFAENDDISAQAPQFYAALTCPKQYLTFIAAEGAGEHCEQGNRSLFHQRAFDWLDEVLAEAPRQQP